MKYEDNIRAVAGCKPDMLGFVFYPKSPRFVGEEWSTAVTETIDQTIQKIGVFVDEDVDTVLFKANLYRLEGVQLHGSESPEECAYFRSKGLEVIKAFGIHEAFDFTILRKYGKSCNRFLFDTATKQFGGSGNVFDWRLLQRYTLPIPFLLSGGLGLGTLSQLKKLTHPYLWGLDFNSKLEQSPACKHIEKVNQLIKTIKKNEYI